MITLSEIVYHTKYCPKCGQIRTRDEFWQDNNKRNGLSSNCRHCRYQQQKQYLLSQRARDKKNKRCQKYDQSDHGREKRNKREKERFTNDPKFKMTKTLRRRFNHALQHTKDGKAVKSARTLDMLGCTIDYFIQHIEQQFQPGMSWQNHGKWHVDHIKPCISFDLTDPAQQKTCFNFSNMQPLWAQDNMKKGAKFG